MTLIKLKSVAFMRKAFRPSLTLPSVKDINSYLFFEGKFSRQLTSGYKSVDIFDFSNGRMITVTHDILDGIDEAVNVDNRSRILNPDLDFA